MANKTRTHALQIHGTNPQFLIDKVTRSRIYDSVYWKDSCFGLTAATLVDKAISLHAVGGSYGVQRPTEFICLVLKMLQLQPEREIVEEYLNAREFKYLRALAAFYIRLTFPPLEIYTLLEPLLEDYRKLRFRQPDGSYRLTYIDELADSLLTEERVCDVVLPRLLKREVLEGGEDGLEPRVSALEEGLLGSDEEDESEEMRERRMRWREKVRRRREMRERRAAEAEAEAARAGTPGDARQQAEEEGEDDEAYASQELSDSDDEGRGTRYVSRSPSRSVSPDRRSRSRSGTPASSRGRYVSRSPSRSRSGSPAENANGTGGGEAGGYVSRSPSRSPDRT